MKVSIATGKFPGFTNKDFEYLQKATAVGEAVIIIVGQSYNQKVIYEHLTLCKFTKYIVREEDNTTPYLNELSRLVGYREASPEDNIELIYVVNPDEQDEAIQDFCTANGVFYMV